MTTKRGRDFDLEAALRDPGFTPRARDATAILDLYAAGGEPARNAERALLRLGAVARDVAVARATPGARTPKLLRLLAKLDGDGATRPTLEDALVDPSARVRRAAANGLGKLGGDAAVGSLSRALGVEIDASARRAILEALGKLGGELARAALEGHEMRPDAAREHGRALVMAGRAAARAAGGGVDLSVAPAAPLLVALRCRSGLEPFLVDELGAQRAIARTGGALGARVELTLRTAPADLFRARTWTSFAFPLEVSAGPDLAASVVASLTSPEALAILRRWTRGAVRYRLAFAQGGKRRAEVWRIAEGTRHAAPDLVNDPRESLWEVVVHARGQQCAVELSPNADDPRFAYRTGDVPAASHPTIAAALARAVGVRDDDVVWDPFAGSGTELCERALLGPYRALVGSDIDAGALRVARANLEACGARSFALLEGDATTLRPDARPTSIVTNPPLGRRVQRAASLAPLLDRFLAHAARVIAPGGRMAWISPFPDRTRETARASSLDLVRALEVDLGGFAAELQVFAANARRGGRIVGGA